MVSDLEENIQKLNRIERNDIFILVAFSLGSIFFRSLPIFLGVVVGGGLFLANFRFLRQIILTAFGHEKMGRKAFIVKVFIKFFLFLGVIGAVLYLAAHGFLPINLLAFAVGISTLIIAIGYEGLKPNNSPLQR